jgi:2-oxoglutarate dehydrogenase E2 component (dihydrolipoamide succinyltransferase)
MSTEIKAPTFPESVADGTIATWHKQPGEAIARDELIVDIETDKVVLEVLASDDGVIEAILKQEGDIVLSGEVIGKFIAGGKASVSAKAEASKETTVASTTLDSLIMSPAAKKLVEENSLNPSDINTTGKDGRLTKEDVVNHLSEKQQTAPPVAQTAKASPSLETPIDTPAGVRAEKRVPMTRLRASIARRLLDASQNTAMLTTFNEVNMRPLMDLRKQYKEIFEKKHDGTKLGFMSLFVKASAEALKRFPAVNASIDGDEIVYHGYQDIGVAVSSEKGLVVPVLRDSDTMSLATIERSIKSYGAKAQAGKLTIEEMTGGTFTISNGGVFGSLMSTPILNPPQTAILGMHKIQERPMAVNGQVVILPMMYLALSYDHRMIDGKEAVQFLVSIKEMIEDPARILLEI